MPTKYEELINKLKAQGWKMKIHEITELEPTDRLSLSGANPDELAEVIRWTCPTDKKAIFVGRDLAEGVRDLADPMYMYLASGAQEISDACPVKIEKETLFGREFVGSTHYGSLKESAVASDFDKIYRFSETIVLDGGESIVIKVKSDIGVESAKTRLMMRCHVFYK